VAFSATLEEDDLTARIRPYFSSWVSTLGLNDEELARRIHAHAVDILFDLAGHTGRNRLPVFAWKPAPVQVTWLGYLGTTGVPGMDYLLADGYAIPVGEDDQFSEAIWRLPDSYLCLTPPALDVAVDEPPALANGYVTFGSFNNLSKVNAAVVACWAKLLHAVPGSRLYLKARQLGYPETRKGVLEQFEEQGLEAVRITLEGWAAERAEALRAYQRVDIALDTFPYPGITTTSEALWMGVPVMTLKGDRFISHQGETILGNLGLADWIAADGDDYVRRAAGFAANPVALSGLRRDLRRRLIASPLCDAPRFARNLETALRGMWLRWCGGDAPGM
jgi:predicted O-linked N-acetylglucosamine transferase (SPINDLY family)